MLEEILENLKNEAEYECYQIGERTYTNRDLYKYVCNVYHYLIKNNAEKGNVVVVGHKEIYMIASFLACSFAGMTYIPLDSGIPASRKISIIEQANAEIIINHEIEEIMQNENYEEINEIFLQENDTYYIMFTSGSTGAPKGVKIAYKNLKSCVNWLREISNVNEKVILNQAIFSFDLSVADIYLSLVTKSKHFILETQTQKDYSKLFENLQKSNANLAVITPSFADLLLLDKSFNMVLMPNLEKILFCGEKLTSKTASKLYERFPNLQIINCYGPTECTFAVTSKVLDKNNLEQISIGIPKKDTDVYIVNEDLEILDDNTVGEIVIAGKSVGQGYLDEKLNHKKFITLGNKNAYLTGDLGYKKGKEIFCVGRKDKQVKYKGYRIELSEIEMVIDKLEEVEKVVVTVIKNSAEKVSKIIAFVKLKENLELSPKELKNKLESVLPDYMIPVIKIVGEFPLNNNAKIDENRLLEEY